MLHACYTIIKLYNWSARWGTFQTAVGRCSCCATRRIKVRIEWIYYCRYNVYYNRHLQQWIDLVPHWQLRTRSVYFGPTIEWTTTLGTNYNITTNTWQGCKFFLKKNCFL